MTAVVFLVLNKTTAAEPSVCKNTRSAQSQDKTTGWRTLHVVKNDVNSLGLGPQIGP